VGLLIPPHLKRVATLPCEILLSSFECWNSQSRLITGRSV